jgi:predicted ATPase
MALKLIGLTINNLRRIHAIELEIKESGLTEIRGKNKQGKTTVLDAVEMLLKGKKFIPADVISHGEDQGSIKGTISDGEDVYIVERVIRDGKPPILHLKKNGAKVGSPETFLSSLVNDITFNPRPFMNKTDLEKQKEMMKIAGIDFTKLDASIKDLFDERTMVGREVKSLGEVIIPEKVEKQSVSILLDERKARISAESARDEVLNKLQDLRKNKSDLELNINQLKKELEEAEAELATLDPRIEKGSSILKGKDEHLSSLRTTEEIDADIDKVEETNEKAVAYTRAVEKSKERAAKQLEYDHLTGKIETLREEKLSCLASAQLPVKGLELREDGLYYNGTHSSNWSESESMRISSDLCINLNPKLRAIFIDRGEAYDSNSLRELGTWAEKNDLQAIITIVSDIPDAEDRDANVYYIEEGRRIE